MIRHQLLVVIVFKEIQFHAPYTNYPPVHPPDLNSSSSFSSSPLRVLIPQNLALDDVVFSVHYIFLENDFGFLELFWELYNVTWVEHVQVDDKALTHPLYRDLIFHGLAYGAERWLLTLQRMCERFAFGMGRTAVSQETVVSTPEGRRSIMNLTHRMVKYLCANLTMKRKLEIPQLAELSSGGIRFSSRKSSGLGQPSGLIVSAATSLRLPLPYQALFDFLMGCNVYGNPFQENARISYGDHPGNHISIIQESCVDPLGAMIVYAPIDIQSVQMAVSGADSSGIPILPSGFIICSDGHPHTGANGASSSTSTANPMSSGSLLTVAFQILTGGDMQLVTGLNALVTSTIQNITSALNCTSLK
ncbi:hypothetical protein RHGRI_031513 [Rhododendron griersonianum]|uniref:START domain-containing protein n=1 Tax=Rhododendron griersonianum TaxID=479676 RepID=A0AAV6IBM6_9ERIC|nr:hypothetical protein RHGRI_031513 [Rhododendron griersonianum]